MSAPKIEIILDIPADLQIFIKASTHSNEKDFSKTLNIIIFFLMLKSASPKSGWIQHYILQIPSLTKRYNISKRTFDYHLDKLVTRHFAFIENNDIRLIGWDTLRKLCQLKSKIRMKVTIPAGPGNNIWGSIENEIMNPITK